MIKKLFYSLLSVVFVSSFQIIALIITSQKASPEQLGLLTMLISVNAFLFLFVDFGLSNYLLHKKSLSESSVQYLKSINLKISFAVFTLTSIVAVALFYIGENIEIINALWLTGVNSIALALTRIERAKLQNEHRFKDIFKIDCITRCAGILGLYGLMYVEYNVVYSYLIAIIAINLSAKPLLTILINKKPFCFGEMGTSGIRSFCIPQALNSILNFFTQNMDIFLIAYTAGLKVSGVYGVIKIVVTKPLQIYMPALMKVYTPLLVSEGNTEKVYLNLLVKVSAVSMLVYSCLAILGTPLLDSLFNIKQVNLSVALIILCLYTFLRAVSMPVGALIIKSGNTKLGLKFTLFQAFCLMFLFFVIEPSTIVDVSILLLVYQLFISVLLWFLIVNQVIKISFFNYFLTISLFITPLWVTYLLR